MKTFYFNTGVRPETVLNFPYEHHRKVGNVIRGTLLIPFECDNVPDDATFMYACGKNDLPILGRADVICREIVGGNMCSKYAYFTLK